MLKEDFLAEFAWEGEDGGGCRLGRHGSLMISSGSEVGGSVWCIL